MSAFTDLLAQDVAAAFLNTQEFAADGHTFYPYGGNAREIAAVVEIEPANVKDGQAHRVRTEACKVHCRESETDGILSPQIRDAFLLAGDDETTQKWDFDSVVSRDGAMIVCRFTRKQLDTRGKRTLSDL